MKWLFVLHIPEIITALHFASYYQDHMVLQRAPQRTIVWGYGSNIGDNVTVVVSGQGPVHTNIVRCDNCSGGVWKVKLPPIADPGPYCITASSQEGVGILKDVLFGDVWMCAGQTDMAFPMSQVLNSTYEIKKAAQFHQVRIFKGSTFQSTKPIDDISDIDVNWSLPLKVHPRYKQDVASRLILPALAVAYNEQGLDYQGPFPSSYTLDRTANTLTIEFSNGKTPIEVRNNTGYEVCCSTQTTCQPSDQWSAAPILSHLTSTVSLSTSACGNNQPVGVRYAWRESPCQFKGCAVYGRDNDLPAPPFIKTDGL